MKPLRTRVLNGETLFGCFLNLGSSLTAEMTGQAGFDWVLLDREHGAGGENELLHQLQALQHTPAAAVVRVETFDRWRVHRALDFGANGIMAPRVDTAEQAQAAAAALHYPPVGIRGVAKTVRACDFGASFKSYVEQARENLLGVVQIESELSLRNLDEIASVEGVDVLFVGPSDLSHSMGLPFELRHPRFQTALQDVVSAAKRHGKVAGIKLGDAELVPRCLDLGYRFIACSSDGELLFESTRALASRLRRER